MNTKAIIEACTRIQRDAIAGNEEAVRDAINQLYKLFWFGLPQIPDQPEYYRGEVDSHESVVRTRTDTNITTGMNAGMVMAGQRDQPDSEPKHTPGPWEHEPGLWLVQGGDGLDVAYIEEEIRPLETCMANAILIAAAPTMYEALHEALSALKPDATEEQRNRAHHKVSVALRSIE